MIERFRTKKKKNKRGLYVLANLLAQFVVLLNGLEKNEIFVELVELDGLPLRDDDLPRRVLLHLGGPLIVFGRLVFFITRHFSGLGSRLFLRSRASHFGVCR